eukprot:scaffold18774_cov220-Cylindrotheca_fusiformis.AAC.1
MSGRLVRREPSVEYTGWSPAGAPLVCHRPCRAENCQKARGLCSIWACALRICLCHRFILSRLIASSQLCLAFLYVVVARSTSASLPWRIA